MSWKNTSKRKLEARGRRKRSIVSSSTNSNSRRQNSRRWSRKKERNMSSIWSKMMRSS